MCLRYIVVTCRGLAHVHSTFQFPSFSSSSTTILFFQHQIRLFMIVYKVNYNIYKLKIRLKGQRMYTTFKTIVLSHGTLLNTLSILDYKIFFPYYLPFYKKETMQYLGLSVWISSLNIIHLKVHPCSYTRFIYSFLLPFLWQSVTLLYVNTILFYHFSWW